MKYSEKNLFFYHIYPLGFTGAPKNNDFKSDVNFRLDKIYEWIPHLKELGINALYLGPVFESCTHGYDTKDYFTVDRRLGTNEGLARLIKVLHENNIFVILDGVFHHVGRDFFAFQDLKEKGKNSSYKEWFVNVDFNKKSPAGDNFYYEGWNGHYSLVKLNLSNNEVKKYLFDAVKMWIDYFKIDGLRLDAADYIEFQFLKELTGFSKNIKSDFYLLGEVIHGDYRKWVNKETLDSVTNYVCYKGLWSSFNDKNFFEIAYSFETQFGEEGIYKNLTLYNFTDNHDVDRVATTIKNKKHLFPLYCLLFAMPGNPAIYYGSEYGAEGKKVGGDDSPLRAELKLNESFYNIELFEAIKKLAKLRSGSKALKYGSYRQIYLSHEQIVFLREYENEKMLVIINSNNKEIILDINIADELNTKAYDVLNNNKEVEIKNGKLKVEAYPCWARFLEVL